MPAGNNKVVKLRKHRHISVGMCIFAVILIYVIACIFIYINTKHIVGYEVMEGSLSTNNIYRGMALRSETVVPSEYSGYVNYFASESKRVAVGNLVYTVDESGELLDQLKSEGSNNIVLSDTDLKELRASLVDYSSTYSDYNFSSVYDFKNTLKGTVEKLSNNNILKDIQSLNSGSSSSSINYCNSSSTGIIAYYTDGYEDMTLENITADMFDEKKYNKTLLESNALVDKGDPVYKITSDENWSIVIQTDLDTAQELADLEYVQVRFLKNQDVSWASVSYYTNGSGDTFTMLSFTNSMLTFAADRFLDIELITEQQKGLKIPNSSIIETSFFIVPKDYLTKGTDNNDGVLRKTYLEDGSESTEFVDSQIYNETEDSYYLGESSLRAGDVIVKPDSTDTFTVSEQDTLQGVYNINKGYADFRQINVLYSNDEYSIVQSNTQYGLNVYDYIVLDTSSVSEDDLVYN